MSTRAVSAALKTALVTTAVAAPLAFAGHLNVLLNADMDGRQEVGPAGSSAIVGDPDGRGEAYVFGIDGRNDVLCYSLQVKRIAELDQLPLAGVRMAHIHKGARGENGPVVANLAWPQGGQAADCLDGVTQPARFGAGVVPADLIADLLANPHNYYVNVHNDEYRGGAVRGQLRVADF